MSSSSPTTTTTTTTANNNRNNGNRKRAVGKRMDISEVKEVWDGVIARGKAKE